MLMMLSAVAETNVAVGAVRSTVNVVAELLPVVELPAMSVIIARNETVEPSVKY